jgi:hypothetical protein
MFGRAARVLTEHHGVHAAAEGGRNLFGLRCELERDAPRLAESMFDEYDNVAH